MKKPGLKLLQNLGCLSGEIMTQTKKRKAIETVIKSVLLSVMFSKFEKKVFNTLIQKIVLVHGSIFLCPFDTAT